MNIILDELLKKKIIAIVRGVDAADMLNLANALYRGGIEAIEVTFAQENQKGVDNSLACMEVIMKSKLPILMGAGTVLTKKQVKASATFGARYIISPNTDVEVIKYTKDLGLVSIPGAMTPSEVVKAYLAGADIVKLFPMSQLGVDYLKALRGPLGYIKMAAVGGVTVQNAADFLAAGAVCLGIGSNLSDHKLIKAGEFEKITQLAKAYVEVVHGK